MRRATLGLAALGLALLAHGAAAAPPGPEAPPPPWFVIADIPSRDPKIADTRWLRNREAHALRYCRKDAATGVFTCAPDVSLPEGRWVLDRIQAQPSDDLDSSARFYSPDRDQTLRCTASVGGEFGCE
ncbi:MAG: hypothetical protein P4L73_06095 [Caulobacteraceae bacterium]|nr:hypothetical protein [Caulobacteraceae bacterium]